MVRFRHRGAGSVDIPPSASSPFEIGVGRLLEVAAGTGSNLLHYPPGADVVIIDLSPRMLLKAGQRGARKTAVMDAQHLAFRDGSFDIVVSTLGTCTFPDPVQALREMRRVCRPGGHILLLEHGRSSRHGVAAWQDAMRQSGQLI